MSIKDKLNKAKLLRGQPRNAGKTFPVTQPPEPPIVIRPEDMKLTMELDGKTVEFEGFSKGEDIVVKRRQPLKSDKQFTETDYVLAFKKLYGWIVDVLSAQYFVHHEDGTERFYLIKDKELKHAGDIPKRKATSRAGKK